MHKLGVWMAGVVALTITANATADVYFDEGFDYPDGGLTIADGTGDNVSGGLWTPHSGETFGDNIQVISGRAEVRASGSEDANRLTGLTMGAGETWYGAFLFQLRDDRADPNSESLNNDYFAHFKDSGFGFRTRIYPDDPNVADPTKFTLGMSATSGGQSQKWTEDFDFGTDHIVVMSYDFDSGAAQMWVDPTDMSSPSLIEAIDVDAGTPIEAFALRQDFIGGTPNNAALMDQIVVGNTFGEVLAAVPEPTSLVLVALGGFGLLRRRRA